MARFDRPVRLKPSDPAIAKKIARQQRELRYVAVLTMLDEHPEVKRAIQTYKAGDRCFITMAIRGLAALEMEIPPEKFDAFNMIEAINKHEGDIAHAK